MPLSIIDLKPKNNDAKLIWVDRGVSCKLSSENDSHYFKVCRSVISGHGWYESRTPSKDIPNPFNISIWKDNQIDEGWPNVKTSLSFSEISDMRALQLLSLFKNDNLPIVVSYSGGIDSALIVVAMCKNYPREILDRVIIKMNNSSYFESPVMFEKIIKKFNLKITDELKYDWDNSYLVTGEPGDAIWITSALIEMTALTKNPHEMSVVKDAEFLINWIQRSAGKETATWFYNALINNAKNFGVTLETFEDFFWWAKTTLAYGSNRLHVINHIVNPWHDESFDLFLQRGIAWYHTKEYRTWSATHRNNGVKFDGTIESYKMPAKKYINDLLKDPYYEKYKTKVYSQFNSNGRIAALFDDGTLIMPRRQFWSTSRIS